MQVFTSIEQLAQFLKQFADENGKIHIVTPQFERTDGVQPVHPEGGAWWFDQLKGLPHETLKAIGMGLWEEGHYLYPKEWYEFIPAGYMVTDIFGDNERFVPGETDDDIRFGCLPYGFRTAAWKPEESKV